MIETPKAAAPSLRVDDLTENELADLERLGRIKDGFVVPAPAKPPPDPTAATIVKPEDIPAMPVGVKERLDAAKQLGSSYEIREGDKVVKSEGDVAAQTKPEPVENPDWADKKPEDPIEFEDKMRFLAHVLGAKNFTKEYTLFGGQLRVTFRTRSSIEEQRCSTQAWNDDDIDGPGGSPTSAAAQAARISRYQNYQFAAALLSMTLPDGVQRDFDAFAKEDLGKNTAVRRAYRELLALPAPLLVILRQTFSKFETVVARMTMAADDEDFWKAASGT